MSIKKQYLKSKPICKVTFVLDKKLAQGASKVNLTGDFNQWNPKGDELIPLKSGSFKITKELMADHEYQFRYLLDDKVYKNDEQADRYVNNGISSEENSVLIV